MKSEKLLDLIQTQYSINCINGYEAKIAKTNKEESTVSFDEDMAVAANCTIVDAGKNTYLLQGCLILPYRLWVTYNENDSNPK